LSFKIECTTECLENTGGLVLAGEISRACGLGAIRSGKRSWVKALVSMFGLLVQGRTSFEEIALYRKNRLFRSAFNLTRVPAKETMRLYLEKLARVGEIILTAIRACNMVLLAKAKFTPMMIEKRLYIPVDVDVSTMDNSKSHKEGVSRTYMGVDGYAPIFSYIGSEGYMLDCELRKGSQHCQKGTKEFLERNITIIEKLQLSHPVLYRLDGGNDSIGTILPLIEKGWFFLIKRNLRKERVDYWLDIAETLGKPEYPRKGKTVYTGTLTKTHPKAEPGMPDLDIVFQVTVRTIEKKGVQNLVPDVEIETWWTNLFESPEEIIKAYHGHGTSEQFHSELKTDMDVERLPSGKMSVNALILILSMFAFNTLRFIGQSALALPELLPIQTDVSRKRIRKVISDLILIGCKLVKHGRQFTLRVFEDNPWLPIFRELYTAFQLL